jgi:hypothetical protein
MKKETILTIIRFHLYSPLVLFLNSNELIFKNIYRYSYVVVAFFWFILKEE